jgi:uncharacterized membrane protein
MFEIIRLWTIDDYDSKKQDIEILYKRPRVDYRISEYVFEYINKSILELKKIMQTGNYSICFSFHSYFKSLKFFEDNIYNTENTKYSFHLYTNTVNKVKYKVIFLGCCSNEWNENIKPKEYANAVYDMVGSFLVKKYKKITKEIMDKNKIGMDYKTIEKYKYPALFIDQKYLNDEKEGSFVINNEEINIKEKYIKYYKE